jgi:hypothetical protein
MARPLVSLAQFTCSAVLTVGLAGGRHAFGGSQPSTLAPVAGSRLAPLYLVAEDGAREFAGWFDNVRGERCAFAVAGDGALRCLPVDGVVLGEVFADPACTVALTPVSTCPSAAMYLLRIEEPVCATSPRRRLYALGKRFVAPAVYERSSAGCAKTARNEGSMFATIGPEIPPISFVAATYTAPRPVLTIKTEY